MANSAITTYETAFKNNIAAHLYTHVEKFLKNFQKHLKQEETDTRAKRKRLATLRTKTLDYAFARSAAYPANDGMLWVLAGLRWEGPIIEANVFDEYYNHLELLYNIQRFNEDWGLKNFNLTPIFRHKRHHVTYDTRALMQLIQLVIGPTPQPGPFQKRKRKHWKRWFKYSHLTTSNHKFDFCIHTDGVAVSLK